MFYADSKHAYGMLNKSFTYHQPCPRMLCHSQTLVKLQILRELEGEAESWGISRSGKEARDCGHEGPGLTGGARLSQLRALDLQADEKGPSQIKLK